MRLREVKQKVATPTTDRVRIQTQDPQAPKLMLSPCFNEPFALRAGQACLPPNPKLGKPLASRFGWQCQFQPVSCPVLHWGSWA